MILVIFSCTLIIGIFIYFEYQDLKLLKSVTQINRGTRSERQTVLNLLKNGIPAQTIFHDLYFTNKNGTLSQVDIVVPTKTGIIVFEIKEYGGWLYGTGNQTKWTQVLAYGREKYQFYNPILQNRRHIESIANQLDQFKNIPFYSIIVFFGNCEFKDISNVPDDVFLIRSWEIIEVINMILNENRPAAYLNKFEILNLFKSAVKNGENDDLRQRHFRNIESILEKREMYSHRYKNR